MNEALLAQYVERALTELDAGRQVDPVQLCREHPELGPTLAEALGLVAVVPRLQAAQGEADRWLGALLGRRYQLVEALGRGASGSVYRAHDLELARDVAVKVLHGEWLDGAAAAERFSREAQVLAQHDHEHVVRVFDRGTTADGRLYLVTELLRGVGLNDVLDTAAAAMPGGPSAAAFAGTDWLAALLPHAALERSYLRQVVLWTAQLGEGLAAAHANGVVHRDVKPSNAFVRDDGRAVLLDFGIAARAGDAALTLPTSVVGTPCYMAPEQASGRSEPRPTLDVWGLCATLYHLLTLRPPHAGSGAEALQAAREREPLPAESLHRGLPADLRAILERGLAHEPRHRYPTVNAVVADLRAFLGHAPVAARPLRSWTRAWRRARRQPTKTLAWVGGGAAALLLAVVLPLWGSVAHARARGERAALLARLPALLAFEGDPQQRLLVPLAERAESVSVLDRLLQLNPDDHATRLMRAAEQLDGGDLDGARADLDQLAARAASPYLAAVAARYRADLDPSRGSSGVDLEGVPPPQTEVDAFVAGFHALRARDGAAACVWLERLPDYLPARDLHLIALLATSRFDEARDEASWLEGRYGQATARTRHALCAAALAAKRYQQAIGYGEDSLRLRPGRHGPWNNLGYAHLRLGELAAAQESFDHAVALRPWFDNSHAGLAQTLRALEDFAAARAQAQQIAADWWRDYELANVDLAEATAARRRGDGEAAASLARRAAQVLSRSLQAPGHGKVASARRAIELANALAGGDDRAALAPFLAEMVRGDLRNPTQLANLSQLLKGQSLDAATCDWLRLYLVQLAIDFAPDDPRLPPLRAEILEALVPPR